MDICLVDSWTFAPEISQTHTICDSFCSLLEGGRGPGGCGRKEKWNKASLRLSQGTTSLLSNNKVKQDYNITSGGFRNKDCFGKLRGFYQCYLKINHHESNFPLEKRFSWPEAHRDELLLHLIAFRLVEKVIVVSIMSFLLPSFLPSKANTTQWS